MIDKNHSPEWVECATIQLDGLRVALSEPVLVKRSRWFCWFPSLIHQPGDVLWAIMNAYADEHVSSSICYLSRSYDGGLSWDEPRLFGDAGLNHLILPDGNILILPYILRPRPDGAAGAPCNLISPQGRLTLYPEGVTVRGWPLPAKSMGPDLGTLAFCFNGQVVRGQNGEYLTTLYGTFAGDTQTKGVKEVWPAVERLLVCVGPNPRSIRLIRAAKRMAASLRAEWIAAYVEAPHKVNPSESDLRQLAEHMRLAESLGAETVTLAGTKASEEILIYASDRNVTKIIVGKPTHPRRKDKLFGSMLDEMVRGSGNIDVYVITGESAEPVPSLASRPVLHHWRKNVTGS